MALQPRPAIITIMGHVDHGKTTLLDHLRKSNVVAGEAGGITQHIGAYSIKHNGKDITFIDTPGHAAFNKMRERGAKVTDIVILVVAANDGVKPQTIESIRHIKNSNVPVVVAINKIDLPNVNLDLAKSGLAEHGLMVTDYGGDIEAVEISALKGKGIDKLLETINLIAELQEITADPDAPLEAIVIESSKDSKKGVSATVIVKNGTLSLRQNIYSDSTDGRVKKLSNALGEDLAKVTPGFAAEIIGFNQSPSVGALIRDTDANYPVVEEVENADDSQADSKVKDQWGDLDFSELIDQKPKLNLIIKADVEGTLEAILQTIDLESTNIISSSVGPVTESDVESAATSNALIISFHTKVSKKIVLMAKNSGVKVKTYDVIYKLIEDLQKQMLKLIEPTIDEVVLGEAEVMQIFTMNGERIAGSKVKTGELKKTDLYHLKRGEEIIADPTVKNMMHGKEDIDSVKAKSEFGMTFRNKKLDFQVGDIIVAYKIEDEE
ncbi:translation initiation factor IF-2 [Candidatus Woesebacteria bacterium]|nr:translation initiation factor IF-2 [Candidatus Woesebacteria bacterium]